MGKNKKAKRERPVAAEQPGFEPQTPARVRREEPPIKLWPALLTGVLIFVALLYFAGYSTAFYIAVPAVAIAVGVIGHFVKWKPGEHITLTTVLFFAFVLMCAAASVYTSYQDFSSDAFGKWLTLFALFLIAVIVCRRKHIRTLMVALAFAVGLVAVLSIDSASLKAPTDIIMGGLMRLDTSAYAYWADGRISGLFNNPNVSGSMFALGIFLSLHLARTAKRTAEKILMHACLAASAMAFLLSFSMGSIGFFVVAVAVYLIAAGREARFSVLVLMVETGLCGMAFGVLSTLGLGKSGAVAVLPDLCILACAAALWLLDTRVGVRLAGKLTENRRAVSLTIGGVAALAVLYVVLGFNLTGGIKLNAGEWVTRSAYPAAGDYTMAVDGVADLLVTVRSQNSQQTAMHTDTVLYQGPAAGAAYTVPEGTRVVYFDFASPAGGALESLTYFGGSSGALKLGYLLLPEFAATRIQGLWANQNVIQRLTFYDDALKIWRQSPLVGEGMGAYEAYRPQVAEFSYVTKYVHNVYLQTMAETGAVGLVLLLGMLGAFAAAAVRGRKDEEHGALAAPLLACLAMACGHGLFEVIFSNKSYLLVLACVLALIQLTFGARLPLPGVEKKAVRPAIAGACAVFLGAFCYFFAQGPVNAAAIQASQRAGFQSFMAKVEECAESDLYHSNFHRVTYLENYFYEEDEALRPTADRFAAELVGRDTPEYAFKAAAYYFKQGENALAFDALAQGALRGRADPSVWDQAVQTAIENSIKVDAAAAQGAKALDALLRETAGKQLDTVALTPEHRSYLDNLMQKG